MKIHLTWIRGTVAALATIAIAGGQLAEGQDRYAPYAPTAPYSNVAPYGVQQTQPPVYPSTGYSSAIQGGYAQSPQQNIVPATQDLYTPATQQVQRPVPAYQTQRYQAPIGQQSYSQYPQIARRMNDPAMPGGSAPAAPTESLPTPAPAAANEIMQGYNGTAPYPTTDGTYNGNSGCNNDAYPGYDLDGYASGYDNSHWFGGVYGLWMTRSRPSYQRYTVGVDSGATGTPYFPAASDTENMSDCAFLVPDWREGVEVRLGSTFATGGAYGYGGSGYGYGYGNSGDQCGCEPSCQPCCQQMYAWEIGWWAINREIQDQFVDGPVVGTFRYYGMINYAGLEYDPGTGVVPVNEMYNYQIPITGTGDGAGGEFVVAQRVRTNFDCQNLELNLMRLPLITGGCGYDCCEPPFTVNGICGVRYFQFDDSFEFGTQRSLVFDGWGNSADELFHDIQMENELIGVQLGANMNYVVASYFNFFWDTNFGLYNNHISHFQRMYNPINGNATFTQEGRDAVVNSSKDEVSFLGEIRVGGGFLFSHGWRAVAAYRAVAVTGVALAPEQIKPEYSNWADTARIDSTGSIVIHGIQAGLECSY